MNIEVLKQSLAGSLAGTDSFPEVVRALLSEGCESYHADLVRMEKTFYAPDGENHVVPMDLPVLPIGAEFDQAEVLAAIRASQRDHQPFAAFLRRVMDAGTTHYSVFLIGQKAIYFGRKGEFHIEEFPRAKIMPAKEKGVCRGGRPNRSGIQVSGRIGGRPRRAIRTTAPPPAM